MTSKALQPSSIVRTIAKNIAEYRGAAWRNSIAHRRWYQPVSIRTPKSSHHWNRNVIDEKLKIMYKLIFLTVMSHFRVVFIFIASLEEPRIPNSRRINRLRTSIMICYRIFAGFISRTPARARRRSGFWTLVVSIDGQRLICPILLIHRLSQLLLHPQVVTISRLCRLPEAHLCYRHYYCEKSL